MTELYDKVSHADKAGAGSQAQLKVDAKGWKGVVHVVEADACTFAPPEAATAVTFSYSLSSVHHSLCAPQPHACFLPMPAMCCLDFERDLCTCPY